MLNNDYSKCKIHGTWMKVGKHDGRFLECETCEQEKWDQLKETFTNHDAT